MHKKKEKEGDVLFSKDMKKLTKKKKNRQKKYAKYAKICKLVSNISIYCRGEVKKKIKKRKQMFRIIK